MLTRGPSRSNRLSVEKARCAAEVLHRPQPVDVRHQVLEAGAEAPDVLARPEVERFVLDAERPQAAVDAACCTSGRTGRRRSAR